MINKVKVDGGEPKALEPQKDTTLLKLYIMELEKEISEMNKQYFDQLATKPGNLTFVKAIFLIGLGYSLQYFLSIAINYL